MTLLVAGALPAALPVEAGAQETAPEVSGHLFEPRPLPYTSAVQRRLRAPEGFTVRAWATGLGNPRIMAFAADGTLYVTRRDTGDVLALADRDGNGRAEFERVAVRGLNLVHGIAIGATACGSPPTPASTTRPSPGRGRSAPRGCFATTCPRPASTPTKTLAFGPDGKLYITAGSTCNNCREPNPEAATMLRSEPDGSARAVVATGLRNTIGFGWHPRTRRLWGWDHGSDWRGDDQPPEELNRIVAGGHYGWPFCFASRRIDRWQPSDPPNLTKAQFCRGTRRPSLTYQAHSAPIGFAFYDSDRFGAATGATPSWRCGARGTAGRRRATRSCACTTTEPDGPCVRRTS